MSRPPRILFGVLLVWALLAVQLCCVPEASIPPPELPDDRIIISGDSGPPLRQEQVVAEGGRYSGPTDEGQGVRHVP